MKFSELGLHPLVMVGVEASQFVECTPIQEATIPHILAGRDIAGLAQTGTGKTAAFALPLIDRIVRSREKIKESKSADSSVSSADITANSAEPSDSFELKSNAEIADTIAVNNEDAKTPAAEESANPEDGVTTSGLPVELPIFKDWRRSNFILVLVPTRELAEQVYENIKRLGHSAQVTATSIYGGTGYDSQKAALKSGVDFIVATPGRLIDLYKEHQLDLNQARAIVFDEADRMFDMGFKDDMKYILRRVPQDRQFLVFSATLNFDVLNTAYEFGANPIEVNVSRDQAKAENVQDEIFHVGHDDKPKTILSLLQKFKPNQVIVFSNFKHNVDRIARFLSANDVPAMGISSLVSQSQRTRIMELFRNQNNDRNILVATDVAARGLDIKGVDMVINYELPDDAENYVHRIGRTGRAGEKGRAYSLVGDRDVEALQRIENYLGHKVTIGWIDDADIVKDFKPFSYHDDRKTFDKPQSSRGPSRGFDKRADRPRNAGGHANRDGDRFDKRPDGNRADNNRPDQGRPDRRPEHNRDNQNRVDRPNTNQNNRPDLRGAKPHRPHDRSEPRAGDQRNFRDQKNPNRSGQGQNFDSSQKPQNSVSSQRPQNSMQKPFQQGAKRPAQSYKHRPGAGSSSKSAAQQKGGLAATVTGFFKKLFGDKQKTN